MALGGGTKFRLVEFVSATARALVSGTN